MKFLTTYKNTTIYTLRVFKIQFQEKFFRKNHPSLKITMKVDSPSVSGKKDTEFGDIGQIAFGRLK